jgi:hypothetical protein
MVPLRTLLPLSKPFPVTDLDFPLITDTETEATEAIEAASEPRRFAVAVATAADDNDKGSLNADCICFSRAFSVSISSTGANKAERQIFVGRNDTVTSVAARKVYGSGQSKVKA